MDEAGLGPNLGPFVVALTAWDVPALPRQFDFWETFADVLTNSPGPREPRLHIADSKQVFQPQRGFAALERGVLSALRLIDVQPRSFGELCRTLTSNGAGQDGLDRSPHWYQGGDVDLPSEDHDFSMVDQWRRSCERNGVRLRAIKVAVIEPRRFNQLLREYDNKSLVVSRVAFRLLRSVWRPDETETFIVADKHGGRNRYDELLAEVVEDEMVYRLQEGAERSDYRVGKSVIRFQPRAEEHGPVALASMTAKYVREVAMAQFNRFWARHVRDIKPTQGYPTDARRFRDEIAETQSRLGIADDDLWRNR
jgi:hypothetical protein